MLTIRKSTELFAIVFLLSSVAVAQVGITLRISTLSHAHAIPPAFAGIGFETASMLPDRYGVAGYFFTPRNTSLITLLQNLGVRNIRVGGGTVDGFAGSGMCRTPIPSHADVRQLFTFAQKAGVKVIYSLRLLNPRGCFHPNLVTEDADTAQWIWRHYRTSLDSFAIGNEPDWHSYHRLDPAIYEASPGVPGSAFPSYLADWEKFATAIRKEVPNARLSGPDTGAYTPATDVPDPSSRVSWTQAFAAATQRDGDIALALQHFYVGHGFTVRCGTPKTTYTLNSKQAIQDMLSTNWVDGNSIDSEPSAPQNACGPGRTNGLVYTPYPWLYQHNLAPLLAMGIHYRLTEANDFLGGVPGASNAFASALWALDFMHWWAAHGASGVNFHNNPWIYTDTIVPINLVRGSSQCSPSPCSRYRITPKGYGIKAFTLGGHGYVEPVAISNPDHMNVTAYAVRAGRDLYVTIINKTSGALTSRSTRVSILPEHLDAASVASMLMTDGHPGDPSLKSATIGGSRITNYSRWLGHWTPMSPERDGRVVITVPPSTAAIVKIRATGENTGPVSHYQDGTLHLFGVLPDGVITFLRHDPAERPSTTAARQKLWNDLPSGMPAHPGVVVARNQDNTLEIFAPASHGRVEYIRQRAPDGPWGSWSAMNGPNLRHLAAERNVDGSLSIFGIAKNGKLYVSSEYAPEAAWSGWTELRDKSIQAGYAVGQNLNGNLEVFGVGLGGHVWSNTQINEDDWSGWAALPGPRLQSQLAVARNLDGRIEIFGIDASGRIWHNWQTTPGGAWHGWESLPGKNLEPGFVVDQNRNGYLVLLGIAASAPHHLWSLTQDDLPTSTFGDKWTDIGGSELHPRLVGSSTSVGRIQIFTIGPNGDVWSNWQLSSGPHWNGWIDLGEKGIRFHSHEGQVN